MKRHECQFVDNSVDSVDFSPKNDRGYDRNC